VDLICSLYSWWEGFGSSSLATLPLGFNCGFISTSTCGLSTGVCSCPGGLGFAPVRARCGGGAAAWVTGILAAPGTQGSWWLRPWEIKCSERYGNQYWPIGSSSCLENPPPCPQQRSLASHSLQGRKELHIYSFFLFFPLNIFVSFVFITLVMKIYFSLFSLLYSPLGTLLSLKKVEFFLPFCFCPSKVGPLVCVNFV